MSIICGIIDLKGEPVANVHWEAMMNSFRHLPSDNIDKIHDQNVFFGCSNLYVTPESVNEKLPYYDRESMLILVSDAIIDNRDELIETFGISSADSETVSDSSLILMAYKKWGHKCSEYLIGDYAFVIYDMKKNEIYCSRDHVGKRTLYYYYDTDKFIFCTLINPIVMLPDVKKDINDQWIADFLSIPGVGHELYPDRSIYKHIMQLEPAHYMTISKSIHAKECFWNPLTLPNIKFKTDDEYEEAFKKIFFEAVKCRTRSIGAVGIMLSGGLDSGSIACVAAQHLKGQNKNLKAFSALPIENYENWLPSYYIADESEYIEAIIEHCGNIDLKYCRSENLNSLSEVDKHLGILEQPYKIVENLFWLDNIAKTASEHECRILLDGQIGNSTISFGDFFIHTNTLFKSFRYITLLKEIDHYCKLHGLSRKKVGKFVFKKLMPYNMQKRIFKLQTEDMNEVSIINKKLFGSSDTKIRLKKNGYFSKKVYTLNETRKFMINPSIFSHLAVIETKLAAYYGIVKRDPSRDKRVIEFCLRIPGNQFVYQGQERSLIRRSMKGIMPDKVRLNYKVKGMQSADWLQRLKPAWEMITEEIKKMLEDKISEFYLDIEEIQRLLDRNKCIIAGETDENEIRLLLICLIFHRFMQMESTGNCERLIS